MSQASMFVIPDPQFFDNNGAPLAGGKLYFYTVGGTTTPKAVYAESAMTTALANPVILDSSGRAKIWLNGYYYVVLTDSLGGMIWTEDNVSSAYSPAAAAAVTMSEWQSQSDILTYINGTQFSVPGDKTAVYTVGRRIKATVTAGTITGSITASVLAAGITTVTVLWDLTEALDAGLSAVWTGIISAIASGMPYQLPIGSIIDWYKGLLSIPVLCYGWVECNGQTLADPLSPLNGQVIPNLNGDAAGADTFTNSKAPVYLRGGTTAGTYTTDAIKAHQHAVTGVTVSAHTHSIAPGGGSTASATQASHTHTVTLDQALQAGNNVAQTGAGNDFWQGGGGSKVPTFTVATATPAITLAGHTEVASANTLSGSVDNNGAATETIPKTVTAVKIMRVK